MNQSWTAYRYSSDSFVIGIGSTDRRPSSAMVYHYPNSLSSRRAQIFGGPPAAPIFSFRPFFFSYSSSTSTFSKPTALGHQRRLSSFGFKPCNHPWHFYFRFKCALQLLGGGWVLVMTCQKWQDARWGDVTRTIEPTYQQLSTTMIRFYTSINATTQVKFPNFLPILFKSSKQCILSPSWNNHRVMLLLMGCDFVRHCGQASLTFCLQKHNRLKEGEGRVTP